MENSMTPREIQTRIRSGASIEDLVAESGMSADRLEAFAGPVLAEREHVAQSAQNATIRRRGEGGTHRRLGELIIARLRSRGLDASEATWDAWRQTDLKWRVVAHLHSDMDAEARSAEFVFDPKGRFSVAHNADARWMIGEEARDAGPEDENTVDFHDELALVRAIQPPAPLPGDEVPASALMPEPNEDTSELDSLYDMLSGISEDSVRIYTGIVDQEPDEELAYDAADLTGDYDEDDVPDQVDDDELSYDTEPLQESVPVADDDPVHPDLSDEEDTEVMDNAPPTEVEEPSQEALVDTGEELPKPSKRRRRAKVPSWDEIMFGGPSK